MKLNINIYNWEYEIKIHLILIITEIFIHSTKRKTGKKSILKHGQNLKHETKKIWNNNAKFKVWLTQLIHLTQKLF